MPWHVLSAHAVLGCPAVIFEVPCTSEANDCPSDLLEVGKPSLSVPVPVEDETGCACSVGKTAI